MIPWGRVAIFPFCLLDFLNLPLSIISALFASLTFLYASLLFFPATVSPPSLGYCSWKPVFLDGVLISSQFLSFLSSLVFLSLYAMLRYVFFPSFLFIHILCSVLLCFALFPLSSFTRYFFFLFSSLISLSYFLISSEWKRFFPSYIFKCRIGVLTDLWRPDCRRF